MRSRLRHQATPSPLGSAEQNRRRGPVGFASSLGGIGGGFARGGLNVFLGIASLGLIALLLRSLFALPAWLSSQEPGPSSPAAEELWLSDFETEDEHAIRWKTYHAFVKRTPEHATHGRFAAQVTFTGERAPAIMMLEYLSRSPERRNWSGYETLRFDIYNPQETQERLLLQMRDSAGRLYKEEIFIPSESAQALSVRLRDVRSYLDLSRLTQLSLFQWRPSRQATFYIDAFRLQRGAPDPSSAEADAAATETAASKANPIAPTALWQAAWASGLVKLRRESEFFNGYREGPISLSLARGEYESAQVALIGGAEPARIRVAVAPLVRADDPIPFPADFIDVRRVDYVRTKRPSYPTLYVGDWPDPLPEAEVIEVPVGKVQSVWITLGAPETLSAGLYEGAVRLSDESGRTESIELRVRVWDFTLPRTAHLRSAFDFYRGRMEEAYRRFVPGSEVWEGRMDELERRYFLNMLKHRLFPLWGADPLKPQFAWDVKRYLDHGLGAFGVGKRGGSNGNNWPVDAVELSEAMVWYRQAALELQLMKLADQAYVYAYDEPQPGDPHAAEVLAALHHEAPGLRTLLVMHAPPDPVRHAEWLKDADILCLRLTAFDPAAAEAFKKMGKEVWVYVSSPAHPYPSLVIDYPSIAHRILPWMAWKYGVSGLLYWCVNYWTDDPWKNPANFAEDQNGNGSLYYPGPEGPIPSIRIEVLRDGIEDYEYLYRLKELLVAAETEGADPALVQKAKQLVVVPPALVQSLRDYAKDPDILLAQRQALAETIEALQSALERRP